MSFYIAVWNYAELVLLVKKAGDSIPGIGEEVEVDFENQDTEFIEGSWGNVGGSFYFTITEKSQSPDFIDGLPVVEMQLALFDFESEETS